MINAIEDLTSRALNETGKQWESMETDILQPITIESSVDDQIGDEEHCTRSIEHQELQISSPCNPKPNISNQAISSCESSSCSSNSFSPESTDAKIGEIVAHESINDGLESSRTNNKINSNTKGDENSHVISTINYIKHIKTGSQALDDNNFQNNTLSNDYSILNNNKNT